VPGYVARHHAAPPAGIPITLQSFPEYKLTSPSLLLNFRIKSIEAIELLQTPLLSSVCGCSHRRLRMEDRLCWAAIGLVATLLALSLGWPAWV
jgi:hypothetical protein